MQCSSMLCQAPSPHRGRRQRGRGAGAGEGEWTEAEGPSSGRGLGVDSSLVEESKSGSGRGKDPSGGCRGSSGDPAVPQETSSWILFFFLPSSTRPNKMRNAPKQPLHFRMFYHIFLYIPHIFSPKISLPKLRCVY